jgi:hypothetical protein
MEGELDLWRRLNGRRDSILYNVELPCRFCLGPRPSKVIQLKYPAGYSRYVKSTYIHTSDQRYHDEDVAADHDQGPAVARRARVIACLRYQQLSLVCLAYHQKRSTRHTKKKMKRGCLASDLAHPRRTAAMGSKTHLTAGHQAQTRAALRVDGYRASSRELVSWPAC